MTFSPSSNAFVELPRSRRKAACIALSYKGTIDAHDGGRRSTHTRLTIGVRDDVGHNPLRAVHGEAGHQREKDVHADHSGAFLAATAADRLVQLLVEAPRLLAVGKPQQLGERYVARRIPLQQRVVRMTELLEVDD